MANDELSPEDQDLTARISQIEKETTGDKKTSILRERIRALLKPRLGGKEPEGLIRVCQLEHTGGSFGQHTYYTQGAETPTGAALPNPDVLPPHLAQLFSVGAMEPCLQHAIEYRIGITGAHISQKKIVPYELLPVSVNNAVELERLIGDATRDYSLTTKEIAMPAYMEERTRKVSAVLFGNSEPYKNENARQQVVQLLQQIDKAITLQKEGKASDEEVRTLVAKLRTKPAAEPAEAQTAAAAQPQQPQQLEQQTAYLAERYVVPARLDNPEEINIMLRIVRMPYEVVLDALPGEVLFRFTQPGYSNAKMIAESTEVIQRLDKAIGALRSTRTREELQQDLRNMPDVARVVYEAVIRPR